MEKYDGTFWKVQNEDPLGMDYYGFKSERLFLHIAYIDNPENGFTCGKIHEGDNTINDDHFNVKITKNSGNELWVDIIYLDYVSNSTLKFIINNGGSEMVVIQQNDGKLYSQETYILTFISYDSLCN
ncbi:MAG TPA: hypothetical protein PLQ69_01130 [Paludibacter sp.]|nr:hypothetical protein [Paludibacter sp.]